MTRLVQRALFASATLTVASALVVAPAHAQTVSVTLSEARTGAPLSYAIVSLEDSTGGRHAPGLTDSVGVALLLAPSPGMYSVRVDRVGMQTWRGPLIELRAGERQTVSYIVGVNASTLNAVVVQADQRCDAADAAGAAIATRWDEARKVLFTAQRIASVAPPTMRIARYERLTDSLGRLEWEQADTSTVRSARPFVTLDPEALATRGYRVEKASGVEYYAPDASVLLSDAFARDHCVRVAARPDEPELTGLAFEPSHHRDVVGIAGTFWLDQSTGELREVEYHYVNARKHDDSRDAGGRLRFERSADGSWFIAEWHVKTARVGKVIFPTLRGQVVERKAFFGMREEGARSVVVAVTGTTGEAGAIAGEVRDHADGGKPLVNARVRVVGTPVATVTDAEGRFVAGPLSPGPYTLRVEHRRLRLYQVPAQRDVMVPAADTAVVMFAVPEVALGYGLVCGAVEASDPIPRGGLVASVVDASTGPACRLPRWWRSGGPGR